MNPSVTEGWSDFFVATTGAGAALAGLIIVAMSVTIKAILDSRTLPVRALATVTSLILVVIASGMGLIPGQPAWLLGLELTVAGVAALWPQTTMAYRLLSPSSEVRGGVNVLRIGLGYVQTLPFVVGGVLIWCAVPGGLGWVAAGILVTFAYAMANCWVLLVEVQR